MKRLLLANLHECPENMHFEQALIRALKAAKGVSLDVVHDFRSAYPFIKKLPPPGGRRLKYFGLAALKRDLTAAYDILAVLDFPKRKFCAAPFLWLLNGFTASKKIFIANHLMPMPGHNPTADIAGKLGLLSVLERAYVLESDDRRLWSRLGVSEGRQFKRGYAVDCGYYTPSSAPAGNYIFSAGSTGRDFAGLALAAEREGLALKIFSNSAVPPAEAGPGARTTILPLAANLHNLRSAVRGARAVVIPIVDGYANAAAGNSIAFIAMACGRPVITRRTAYMERFIRDGKNGFLYKKLSGRELGRQLKRALSLEPRSSCRLAAAARADILEKASLDAFAALFARECV